jgi:alpha-mannosidase
MEDIDSRTIGWNCGNGPFKFIGDLYNDFDCQYTRPKFTYDKTVIAEAVKQAMAEQDDDWTTMHRFWSCGHDSSCPDVREIQMIKDCNHHLQGQAEVFHSTFEDFQEQIIKNVGDDLPVAEGEMRYYSDSESTSPLFGWIISARMDIKQDNFKTERDLTQYAEPLAVFAGLLGAEYPQGYLDQAYNWLLQNHGHDSIGGCSRDIIGEDMLFRTRQSREIAGCVAERALLDIAGAIDFADYANEQVVLLVYNPAPFERDEVLTVNLDVPRNWQAEEVQILDENSRPVELQVLGSEKKHFQIVQSPNDTANMFETSLFRTKALIKNLPPLGYKVLRIRGLEKSTPTRINSMVCGANAMENEFLRVQVNSNGTLKITDKIGNKVYDEIGYFRDAAEVGNPWQHEDVEERGLFTTLNENAQVSVVGDGELESALRVAINFSLPESRTADDRARSDKYKIVSIVNTVTLRKGQKWVEIVTDVDNTVEDHYLQVAFPSRIEAETVFAQGQFDVLERPVKLPFSENYREPPQPEQPMNSFIDITDGINGLAILNEGMKAYEASDQSAPELRLTLLRCFPLRICVTQEMTDYSKIDKGSQCLGSHRFRYAVMPHRGNWADAGIWQAAEKFNLTPVVAQTAPTGSGTEPPVKSFLKIEPDTLHLSAVKRSENGSGWIVRIFNPFDKTVDASICLNDGFESIPAVQSPVERLGNNMKLPCASEKQIWRVARIVSLEEIPERDLKIERDGSCNIQVPSKKIMTIEFLAG